MSSLAVGRSIKELTSEDFKAIAKRLEGIGLRTEAHLSREEKPIYVCNSSFRRGRWWCDWYKYDVTNKQYSKAFDSFELGNHGCYFHPATVASGSVIYVIGGNYTRNGNAVFYFDVDHPRDGWKRGPWVDSTKNLRMITCVDGKIYLFNPLTVEFGWGPSGGRLVECPFAHVFDTTVKEAGWESLAENENDTPLSSSLMLCHDPLRNQILFNSYLTGLFAYSLTENKWKDLDSNFTEASKASVVLDGVLYYHPSIPSGCKEILCAYDLVHHQKLAAVYKSECDSKLDGSHSPICWVELLSLGCGKLCLVGSARTVVVLGFLKLNFPWEDGEKKVHITTASIEYFPKDSSDRFVGALVF